MCKLTAKTHFAPLPSALLSLATKAEDGDLARQIKAFCARRPLTERQFVGDCAPTVKFSIDIDHPLAWHAIQELGNVLNYLSVTERLPNVFMPVSPPSS